MGFGMTKVGLNIHTEYRVNDVRGVQNISVQLVNFGVSHLIKFASISTQPTAHTEYVISYGIQHHCERLHLRE